MWVTEVVPPEVERPVGPSESELSPDIYPIRVLTRGGMGPDVVVGVIDDLHHTG